MENAPEIELPRLQKALAAVGVASRRACETLITDGKVTVNGKVCRELGTRIDPEQDDVRVDGEQVLPAQKPKPIYVMLNKPIGYACTVSDPHAEHTIMELVDQIDTRLYPVGRLDIDSAGLLLLTNDGEFANRLTHPRYHVPKLYRVRAKGFVDREAAKKLMDGIDLPDGRTAPAELRFVDYNAATKSTIMEMTLYEGRNRQVRRMLEAVGNPVRELTRIGFGQLRLGPLNLGTWRKLRPSEVETLLEMAKAQPIPPKSERRAKLPYRPRNVSPPPQLEPEKESVEKQKAAPRPRAGNARPLTPSPSAPRPVSPPARPSREGNARSSPRPAPRRFQPPRDDRKR